MSCHGTGAAGAPKLGDAAAWAPRIAAGMDSLLANATNGLNAMPPMGLCMACSQEELQGAIEYMVEKSQ
jgi:cytochrome c5